MVQLLVDAAQKLGSQVKISPIAKYHQPDKNAYKFIDELQVCCWIALEKRQINQCQYSFILGMAIIELIKLSKEVLSPEIGINIALHNFIQMIGSKVNFIN